MRQRCLVGMMLMLLSLLSYGQASVSQAARADTILCWQEKRPLTEQDFQAHRPLAVAVADSVPGTFLAATTESKAVVYDFRDAMGRPITVVRVEFNKARSWLNQSAGVSMSYTMAHEQLHFDLTELTGRKMRYALAQYGALGKALNGAEVTAAITCIYEEEADLQNLYDEETQYGNDAVQQGRWTALIYRSLQQLKRYKSTAADCW